MRPYKIPKSNTWVDLDTIQSMSEPEVVLIHGSWINLTWQHAFRNGPDSIVICEQPEVLINPDQDKMFHQYEAEKNSDGEATMIPIIYEEVFKPFYEAWTGQKL